MTRTLYRRHLWVHACDLTIEDADRRYRVRRNQWHLARAFAATVARRTDDRHGLDTVCGIHTAVTVPIQSRKPATVNHTRKAMPAYLIAPVTAQYPTAQPVDYARLTTRGRQLAARLHKLTARNAAYFQKPVHTREIAELYAINEALSVVYKELVTTAGQIAANLIDADAVARHHGRLTS